MAMFPDDSPLAKGPRRRASDVSTRRARARALAFMAIALIAGLAAAYMITKYIAAQPAKEIRVPTVKVAVAAAEMQKRVKK